MLSQESVFIAHFKIVQKAMRAGHNDKLLTALKQLPYRSAFRDLRMLAATVNAYVIVLCQ